jgi:parallel beta-helix repeat protein
MNLSFVSEGAAANCGGAVPCQCGDTVRGTAVLSNDLGICPGTGLRLVSGSKLDCAGYTITGSNLSNAKYGLLLDKATGAEAKNCRLTGFRRNIRIVGGSVNTIQNNEVFEGKYGIDLASATKGNLISGNTIRNNRDEGIHVGTGADNNTISDNTFIKNKAEHVYLLSVTGCMVTNNTMSKSGKAAVFVKHSDNNTIANNTIKNGPIHIRGDSSENVMQSNQLKGYGYIFEAYEETTGWTYPHHNQVIGGSIQKADVCFRFVGSYDNQIDQVQVSLCTIPVILSPLGGQESTGNVINFIPAP